MQLLNAAASVIAEVGYDAATMTEIAERSNASIGSLYQYFPNKSAVVVALRTQYGNEMEEHTAQLEESTAGMPIRQVAHRLIDDMVLFFKEHPAYFPVRDAPVKYKRNRGEQNRLGERLVNIFRGRKPALSREQAYRITNVSLEIIKGMKSLYAEAAAKERNELVREYKHALAAYLESRLAL